MSTGTPSVVFPKGALVTCAGEGAEPVAAQPMKQATQRLADRSNNHSYVFCMECQRLVVNISCVACRPILRRAPGRNRRRSRVCEKNVCPAILAAWLLWKEKD